MKHAPAYLVLLIAVFVLLACGGAATPAPAPAAPAPTSAPAAAEPTKAPAAAAPRAVEQVVTQVVEVQKPVITTPTPGTAGPGEADWARIRAAGRLLVGTSSGSAPFAQNGPDFRLSGFDVALAQEIGRRLGLQVQIFDLAAEGLPDALQVGQIDAGIATLAASVTEMAPAELSRPYFVSDASVLARPGADIGAVRAAADLARHRIGVQQGTRFEAWAQANLVSTGQIPAANLLLYRNIDQAARDLSAGRSDAVLLDRAQAARTAAQGGASLVGTGLQYGPAAVAVRPGATRLRDEIDRALAEISQDGTLTRLAGQELGLAPADLLPLPATGAGGQLQPTATPAGCVDGMAWVADLTYADDDMRSPPALAPGQAFVKSVRLRNIGTCAWEPGYVLAYAFGNSPQAQMGGGPVYLQSTVPAGAEDDLALALVAPAAPGLYLGAWEMRNKRGIAFGERISVGIAVQESPVQRASPTPAPGATPTLSVGSFTVDRIRIPPGECVSVAWNIQEVNAVYFYAEGQPWEQHPATGVETRRLCPAATTTYELRVIHFDGSTEIRRAAITVDANPEAPIQISLATTPESQLRSGDCVELSWEVTGTVDRVRILRDEQILWDDAPQAGNLRDCPVKIGNVQYSILASGPRETVRTQRILKVTQ